MMWLVRETIKGPVVELRTQLLLVQQAVGGATLLGELILFLFFFFCSTHEDVA